ncbi:MAG TPA: hypothetical protein VLA19_33610, partial [Herpetosiphonaceae bacterium]|nr:hypothetical protein [Herpetosiphonaceae bacterium]
MAGVVDKLMEQVLVEGHLTLNQGEQVTLIDRKQVERNQSGPCNSDQQCRTLTRGRQHVGH